MTDRVVFIFPGYPYKPTLENYLEVSVFFDREGFKIEPVEMEWTQDLHENAVNTSEKVSQKLEKYDNPEVYFFGHSMGAVIALTISPEFSPEAQVLAGMSPEFEEDWQSFSRSQKLVGSAVEKAGSLLGEVPERPDHRPILEVLAQQDIGDIYLVYGETEYRGWKGISFLGMGSAVSRRAELLDAEEVIARDSTHAMESEKYMEMIEDIIREL